MAKLYLDVVKPPQDKDVITKYIHQLKHLGPAPITKDKWCVERPSCHLFNNLYMSDRFENEQYLSWLKLSLALIYTKEALENFTDREVCALHNQLRPPGSSTGAPSTCCACLKGQIKTQWFKGTFKCYGNICDKWIKGILRHHVFPRQVEWDNVDISQLPLVPWVCMKMYIPFGYQQQSNVQEFDLAALLSLYLNCRHFHAFFNNINICEQVKDVRNRVMHSGQMKVDTAQLLGDVTTIKALLQDIQHLIHDPDCQEGVRKIDELMADELEIGFKKELESRVLNSKIPELEDKVVQMQTKYDKISNELHTLSEHVEALKVDRVGNKAMGTELQKVKQDIIQLNNSADQFTSFMTTFGTQGVLITRLQQCESTLTSLSQSVEKTLHQHEQIMQQQDRTVIELQGDVTSITERQATEQINNKRRLDGLEKITKRARASDTECSPEDVPKILDFDGDEDVLIQALKAVEDKIAVEKAFGDGLDEVLIMASQEVENYLKAQHK